MHRLQAAFNLFYEYNKQDPRIIKVDGVDYPTEYFYALQLHNWVKKLAPAASEPLLLASRCQHIGRWQMPRSSYPDGKAGYLNWRKDLALFHAAKAAELLQNAGYGQEEISAVQHIVLKDGIKLHPDVQVMENALCLVFLQFQYEDFLQQQGEDKMIRILQKSWRKMDADGRSAALTLTFGERAQAVLEKALNE